MRCPIHESPHFVNQKCHFEKSNGQISEIKIHLRNQTDKFWKSKNHLRNQTDKTRIKTYNYFSDTRRTRTLGLNYRDFTAESMSLVERNWQTTRLTIRERSKFIFNNDLFSDVKFVVQNAAQGESESKQVIPAHKFVLSIGPILR